MKKPRPQTQPRKAQCTCQTKPALEPTQIFAPREEPFFGLRFNRPMESGEFAVLANVIKELFAAGDIRHAHPTVQRIELPEGARSERVH